MDKGRGGLAKAFQEFMGRSSSTMDLGMGVEKQTTNVE